LTGVPETQVNRLAKIFQRAPNAMQSGTNNTHQWTMEFDNTERWENPLMGWTSSGDPHSNTVLSFDSMEQAIAFALRNGYTYQVMKPQKSSRKYKSYGDNFSWDKKTRVSSK
jgi:NADH dehydrogenase (ubiquinone) Fe-S protein 4